MLFVDNQGITDAIASLYVGSYFGDITADDVVSAIVG